MLRSPSHNERESHLLVDVASAVDAGLTAKQILAGPATASLPGRSDQAETLTQGLIAQGLQLAPHEVLMLETAESAGTLSKVLRILSRQRSHHAERHRELRRRLAYPAFLLGFSGIVACLVVWALGTGLAPLLTVAGILAAAVGAGTLAVRQTLRDPDRGWIPLVRRLILDLGELPYLYSLHGLYGAGVKVHEAHALAMKTSGVPSVRRRLEESGRALARGGTLSEALHLCSALHPETRQMLAAGEASGDLEETLARAVQRRQTSVDLHSRRLVTVCVVTAQVLAFAFAGYVILSFWSGYYSALRSFG